MAEIVISGKTVTLRDEWTGRTAFRASTALDALRPHFGDPDKLRAHADSAYDSQIALCQSAILSWEFDGDPADPTAYDALNMMEQSELFTAVLVAVTRAIVPTTDEKKE